MVYGMYHIYLIIFNRQIFLFETSHKGIKAWDSSRINREIVEEII